MTETGVRTDYDVDISRGSYRSRSTSPNGNKTDDVARRAFDTALAMQRQALSLSPSSRVRNAGRSAQQVAADRERNADMRRKSAVRTSATSASAMGKSVAARNKARGTVTTYYDDGSISVSGPIKAKAYVYDPRLGRMVLK